jgi:ubiquinone/menaquinone biosynthesis C-methylase UbiE
VSIGRRKVRLSDESSWVFNRMVDAYAGRPEYPPELIAALTALLPEANASVLDVGAGIGHLSIPLATRGYAVTAVEPALGMLQSLQHRAQTAGVSLHTVQGAAEELPFDDAQFDLVLVADVVHFLDSERAAQELNRVRARRGAMALLTCEFAPTPYMNAVVKLMEEAAPRRPRETSSALTELLAVSGVKAPEVTQFFDETPVDHTQLEQILRSISFIGPAMNAERYAAFRDRLHAIDQEPRWARVMTLRAGRGRR